MAARHGDGESAGPLGGKKLPVVNFTITTIHSPVNLTCAALARCRPRTRYLVQCCGEKEPDEEFSEADVLSAVRFDESGDFLATGDKGGRVVIFERAETGKVRRACLCGRLAAAHLLSPSSTVYDTDIL